MSNVTAKGFPYSEEADELKDYPALSQAVADYLDAHVGVWQSGRVSITPVASTPTSIAVVFPVPFAAAPNVVASNETTVLNTQVRGAAVSDITATGFNLWVWRTTTTATWNHWIARG